ncbi:GNAT family N-acetyltransferase [Allorhizobium sp. BGMRC 0089]|uniref:GNAT family N-acetyltransferase n=1 Tax=Allorhizobium sonneratiae TaxID=2934936 RepID=UPI0020343205|nr:GNAT family N-acetyltransferase [Allorhizobium sonneratiae]MCM2291837.1 GNAT family N-acetyltransferase [Allorhizobium sonneratiae]
MRPVTDPVSITDAVPKTPPPFHLEPLARKQAVMVSHLILPPEQSAYVSPIEAMTGDDNPAVDFHRAVAGEDTVGFFKIDRTFPTHFKDFDIAAHGFAEGDLGLRGLLIGGQYQGKGHGKALMLALPHYLARQYPEAGRVFLTVNCRNANAIALYNACGWQDTGTLYHGGRAGPQHLMRLELAGS